MTAKGEEAQVHVDPHIVHSARAEKKKEGGLAA